MGECSKCGQIKPESDFYSGHKQCKPCVIQHTKDYKARHRNRLAESRAKWLDENREKHRQIRKESRARNRSSENARQQAYRDANRIKKRAWAKVAHAIRRGRLVKPDACTKCGSTGRIEGSHDDYTKPLEVEWLCVICHRAKDQKRGMGPWAKRRNDIWETVKEPTK